MIERSFYVIISNEIGGRQYIKTDTHILTPLRIMVVSDILEATKFDKRDEAEDCLNGWAKSNIVNVHLLDGAYVLRYSIVEG